MISFSTYVEEKGLAFFNFWSMFTSLFLLSSSWLVDKLEYDPHSLTSPVNMVCWTVAHLSSVLHWYTYARWHWSACHSVSAARPWIFRSNKFSTGLLLLSSPFYMLLGPTFLLCFYFILLNSFFFLLVNAQVPLLLS